MEQTWGAFQALGIPLRQGKRLEFQDRHLGTLELTRYI